MPEIECECGCAAAVRAKLAGDDVHVSIVRPGINAASVFLTRAQVCELVDLLSEPEALEQE